MYYLRNMLKDSPTLESTTGIILFVKYGIYPLEYSSKIFYQLLEASYQLDFKQTVNCQLKNCEHANQPHKTYPRYFI